MENKSTLLSADFTILDQCFELLKEAKDDKDIYKIQQALGEAKINVEKEEVFYALMRSYVDIVHKESNNISNIEGSEIASNNESIISTQKTKKSKVSNIEKFLNKKNTEETSDKNSIINLKKEEIVEHQEDNQSQSKKLKDEYNQHKDKYNKAIISFCEKETNKSYSNYYVEGKERPLIWYILLSNGGSFFQDKTILKIIENTSDKNLTTQIKDHSLFDYIIDQNIGGNCDLSKIINSLLDRGVVVNYDNPNVLDNLLSSHRMNSSNVTSTLWPKMAEKCIEEVAKEGNLKLFYSLIDGKNIIHNERSNLKKDITSFIDQCNDGELLNKMLYSALVSNHDKNRKIHSDEVFSALNKKDIFGKIKITPETLYEIINLEPQNRLLFESAVSNIFNQIKEDSTILDKQKEITRFLGTRCGPDGLTSFLSVCKKGWDNALSTLIELDQSCVKHQDLFGNNALDIAVDSDLIQTSRILIKSGVKIREKAFISAVRGNQETMAQLLLENGANPNSISYEKLENLNNKEIDLDNINMADDDKIEININPITIEKKVSALEIAIEKNNPQMISILVENGALIRDGYGNYLEYYSDYKNSLSQNKEGDVIENYFYSGNNLSSSYKYPGNNKIEEKEKLINQELDLLSSYSKQVTGEIDQVIERIAGDESNEFKQLILKGIELLKNKSLGVVVIGNQDGVKMNFSPDEILGEVSRGKTFYNLLRYTDSKEAKEVFQNNQDLIVQGKFGELLEIISRKSETNKSIKVSSAKQMSGHDKKQSNSRGE